MSTNTAVQNLCVILPVIRPKFLVLSPAYPAMCAPRLCPIIWTSCVLADPWILLEKDNKTMNNFNFHITRNRDIQVASRFLHQKYFMRTIICNKDKIASSVQICC
jgi:hypothetical protein